MSRRSTSLFAALATALLFAPLAIAQVVDAGAPAAPPPPPPPQIIATVVGLRNNTGIIDVSLYYPNAWLQDARRAGQCFSRIANRTASCVIRPPRPGAYALAFGHDENQNGRVDQGFLGIPLEGYGFSNNARPVLSPPSFDACRVQFNGGTMSVRMNAQY